MKIIRLFIVVLALTSFPHETMVFGKSSKSGLQKDDQYNVQGMRYYKKKNYATAAEMFQKAIKINPKHKKANYNLACVYALMIDMCDMESTYKDVFMQLRTASMLDPAVKEKAKKDKDFHKVNNMLEFLAFVGEDLYNSTTLKKALVNNYAWYDGSCSDGAYGCSYIQFKADMTFIYHPHWLYNELMDKSQKEQEKIKLQNNGTYTIENGILTLKFNNGNPVRYKYSENSGKLEETSGKGYLSEINPDPCSA